jgi:hypothetical protein
MKLTKYDKINKERRRSMNATLKRPSKKNQRRGALEDHKPLDIVWKENRTNGQR